MKTTFLFLILFLQSTVGFAEEFQISTVSMGKLRIGMSAGELQKHLSQCSFTKGGTEEWGADGMFHQQWEATACGLEFDMISETADSEQSVASIYVTAPSSLATDMSIRVGSTEDDVVGAYKPFINPEESSPHELLVVGSVYEGMQFTIEKHVVKSMFVGSSAE